MVAAGNLLFIKELLASFHVCIKPLMFSECALLRNLFDGNCEGSGSGLGFSWKQNNLKRRLPFLYKHHSSMMNTHPIKACQGVHSV